MMDPSRNSKATTSSTHQNFSSSYQVSPPLPPPSSIHSSSFNGLSPGSLAAQDGDYYGGRAASFSSVAPNPSLLRLGAGGRAGEMDSDFARRGSAHASLGSSALDGPSPSGGDAAAEDQLRRSSQAGTAAYNPNTLEHLMSGRAQSVSAQGSLPSSSGLPKSPNARPSLGGGAQPSALSNHHHLVAPSYPSSTASSPLASHGRPAIARHAHSDGPDGSSSSQNPNSFDGGSEALSAALASGSLASHNGGAFPPSPAPSQLSHASGSTSIVGANGLVYGSSSTSHSLDGLMKSSHGSNLSFSGGPIPSSSSQDPSLLLPVSTALHGPLSMSDPRTQLSISNLPYRVRWQDLKDLFRKAGTVLRADVALTQDNRSMGHGTVLMATEEDAHRACEMFRGFSWQGRSLDVNIDRSGTLLGSTVAAGAPSPGILGFSPHVATVNASPLAPSPLGNQPSSSPAGVSTSGFPHDQQRASSPNPSLYPFLAGGNGSTGSGGPGSASGSQHAGNHSHSHSSAESASGGSALGHHSFPNGIGGSSLPPPHGMMQQQQQHSLQPPLPSGWGSAGGPTLGNANHNSPMLGGGGARNAAHIPSGWGRAATGGSNAPSQRGSVAAQGGLGGFSQAQVQNAAQLQAQVAALHPYLQQALGFNAGNNNLNTSASGAYSSNSNHNSNTGYSSHQNPGAGGYAYPSTAQQAQQAQAHYAQYQQHNQQPGPQSYYGRVLFVGNLPFHCQWQDLKDLFRAAGNIQRADVALGPEGRSRGFGTVLFASVEDAQNAVRIYHGYEYSGRTLKVHFDRFAQTMVPPGAGTPGTPSQYTAAFAATQPPSHVNHSNLKQKEPLAPPLEYNPQQQNHHQRLQHLYLQQQQHVQTQQQQVQQLQQQQQQQQHHHQSRSRQQEQQMAQLGMSNGQPSQTFSAFGLPPTSQQPQWGLGQQQPFLPSNVSRNQSIDGSADLDQSQSAAAPSGGARPGRIAMPPSAFPGVMGAMSPMQMRMSVPMTPGMPGFTFQAIPQTPPLHPHFLSPGLGPFSPPLGSPHITGPGQLAGSLQSGPPTPFANQFINAAPGAPLHQQMQNVTTPGAHGNYNPMFPMTGNSAAYPPPTPHWSQPPRPQSNAVHSQDEKKEVDKAADDSASEGQHAEEHPRQGHDNDDQAAKSGSRSPQMQDGYPFPVVSNQSSSLIQRRASTNSPAASPGGINVRNHLNDSFSGAAERRGSIPSNSALQSLVSTDPEELAKAIAKMSVRGTALSKEREKHPLAREYSDPYQTLSLESLRAQNIQSNANLDESALSVSQGGTPVENTDSQLQGSLTPKEAFPEDIRD